MKWFKKNYYIEVKGILGTYLPVRFDGITLYRCHAYQTATNMNYFKAVLHYLRLSLFQKCKITYWISPYSKKP